MSKGHISARWCVHFTGLFPDPCCEAGVRYEDVRDPERPGSGQYRQCYPCFAPGDGGKVCPHQEFATPEALAAQAAEDRLHRERMVAQLAKEANVWHPDGDRPMCADGKHRARLVAHLDGRSTFSNLYECVVCGASLNAKQERRGMDKRVWEAQG